MRILGIDYGEKRTGIALGVNDVVQPLRTVDTIDAIDSIVELADKEKVGVIVIGLPLLNGQETKSSSDVREFTDKLKLKIKDSIEIAFVDETRSSSDAVERSIEMGVPQKRRKDDHSMAAGEIIRRFHSLPTLKV